MRLALHSPLYRNLFHVEPPRWVDYELEQLEDDVTRLTLTAVGFDESELEIEAQGDVLVVRGETEDGRRSLHRRFQLGEHQEVIGARLEKGLLTIDIKRELPEALKPRRIAIEGSAPAKLARKAKKLIEGAKKAA